jgi:hypothetical protein
MQNEEIQEKYRNQCMHRFGVENVSKLDRIKIKKIETSLQNYGVTHPMRTEEVKQKLKRTNLKKYGFEHSSQSSEVKEKIVETNLKKYGVEHILQVKEFREKGRKTCLKKYGVEHAMQSPKIFEKYLQTSYNTKEYCWKSGEISLVQGYEPIILSELEEQGYSFDDIITDHSRMPEFWYEIYGVCHRYFPDIYIPKENLIIEVKSSYTVNCDTVVNNLKFLAVINSGYNFRLEIR